MKKLLALALAAGLTLGGGCKKDSKSTTPSKTGPGAGGGPTGAGGAQAPAGKKVVVKLPAKVDLTPGKAKAVKIEILRGPDAKGEFTLTFKPDKDDVGLAVNPTPVKVKPADKDFEIQLSAASVGLTTVGVTGQGDGVSVDPGKFEVEVNN